MNPTDNEAMNAPWWNHCMKLKAMFADDSDVRVSSVEAKTATERVITLKVSNPIKAFALAATLRKHIEYGNFVLTVMVDDVTPMDKRNGPIYSAALAGNPNMIDLATVDAPQELTVTYPIMSASPIQFSAADNTDDYYGNVTVLPTDVAKDIFEENSLVKFSTQLLE